jgi:hypothetical protein
VLFLQRLTTKVAGAAAPASFASNVVTRSLTTMHHHLFPSITALLDPATLSALVGQPITSVHCRLLSPPFAKSGSRISAVETNGGSGPTFVLKQVALTWDWLMRATEDVQCRSVTLWTQGILDQLPPMIDTAVVACARDAAGWAILMRDVGADMYVNRQFSAAANRHFLCAMATLHAQFLHDPRLHDPALALCRLEHVYGMFSPQTGLRELGGPDELPRLLLEGWAEVDRSAPPDVAALTRELLADLTPLCTALRRYPQTLVHGDWRHANQGLRSHGDQAQVILLDWQLAACAPPAVELGRYLGANAALLPGSKTEALAIYAAHFAELLGSRFDETWWRPQLALGLLGGFVQDGWAIALKATHWHVGADARERWQADLQWWAERVREGAAYL